MNDKQYEKLLYNQLRQCNWGLFWCKVFRIKGDKRLGRWTRLGWETRKKLILESIKLFENGKTL